MLRGVEILSANALPRRSESSWRHSLLHRSPQSFSPTKQKVRLRCPRAVTGPPTRHAIPLASLLLSTVKGMINIYIYITQLQDLLSIYSTSKPGWRLASQKRKRKQKNQVDSTKHTIELVVISLPKISGFQSFNA
jgi:hypothetical protein